MWLSRAGGGEELERTVVPEVYVVFCESRSTTFRLLSLVPWRMPGATDGKTATLGQRGSSLSCTSMVLTALMTSGGKWERLKSRMLRQSATLHGKGQAEGQGREGAHCRRGKMWRRNNPALCFRPWSCQGHCHFSMICLMDYFPNQRE